MQTRCGQCGKEADNLSACSGCRTVYYCDRQCQKKNWLAHKAHCGTYTKALAAVSNAFASRDTSGETMEAMFAQFKEAMRDQTMRSVVTMADVESNLSCLAKLSACLRVAKEKTHEALRVEEMRWYGVHHPLLITHNAVTLASSTVHGQGVFALAQLPANVIITFYPCDAIQYPETGLVAVCNIDPATDWCEKDSATLMNDYRFSLTAQEGIIGNPRRPYNPRLLGHCVNDGATDVLRGVRPEALANRKLLWDKYAQYCEESARRMNCMFDVNADQTIVAVVTRRRVEPGEELFIVYGFDYWLTHHYGADYNEKHPFIQRSLGELPVERKRDMALAVGNALHTNQ